MSLSFEEIRSWSESEEPVALDFVDVTSLLAGASPRAVLRKIVRGDPLAIEARCGLRLCERALLVDRQRLAMRAAAQVAFSARGYRASQPMSDWLLERIDRSIAALIERDREAARCGAPTEPDESWSFLTAALGVPPLEARQAALTFNDLPLVVRRVFWRAAVEGVSFERCVADGLGNLAQVRERAKRALLSLSLGMDPGGADHHGADPYDGRDFDG